MKWWPWKYRGGVSWKTMTPEQKHDSTPLLMFGAGCLIIIALYVGLLGWLILKAIAQHPR